MNRETSNVLLGFLVGAVAGGVAALMFAPSSGKETRQKIVDGLGRTREKLQEELTHAKDYTKTQKEALKEGFHEGKEAYKRAAGKGETV
ncbi:MAG: YtxH domain-containing protein [Desulfuromonadales bacterium]|nr:YtxH domain-containing protein [Desulfuromonadales bacterium]